MYEQLTHTPADDNQSRQVSKEDFEPVLIIVDAQNDFITGPLGSHSAQAIVEPICEFLKGWKRGRIFMLKNTRSDGSYLATQEGEKLPIKHSIWGTDGWLMNHKIHHAVVCTWQISKEIQKHDVGYLDWKEHFMYASEIHLIGMRMETSIITNALILKTIFPEVPIYVHVGLCAGGKDFVDALNVMECCQINLV